jgi:hypothetical protein
MAILTKRLEWLIMIPTFLISNIVEQMSKLSLKIPEERELIESLDSI